MEAHKLNWFDLDAIATDVPTDSMPDLLADALQETVDGDTVKLDWFELDKIRANAKEGSAGRERAAKLQNELV